MKSLSRIARSLKRSYSQAHLFAAKTWLYFVSLISRAPDNIFNKLNAMFPSEYSIDLISQSHIVVLKCSGKSVFIRDIIHSLISDSLSAAEKAELHGFGWISLLNLDADKQWRLMIRNHIKSWVNKFKPSDGVAWNPSVISERLYNWITQYNLISKTADAEFNLIFARSIVQHLKLLKRLMYLPLDMPKKLSLIRATIVAATAINDSKTIRVCSRELFDYLQELRSDESNYSMLELLKSLRYLVDIQSIFSVNKLTLPNTVSSIMLKIAAVIRQVRHPDGGISIFQSEFTPSIEYVDAVLSHVEYAKQQNFNAGFLCLNQFEGSTFINLNSRYFPIEFSAGTQRIILGTYLRFVDKNLWLSENAKNDHSVVKEKNNVWFSGVSRFKLNDNDVKFDKKLYINNLGTDIRCEESMSGTTCNVERYIVLPDNIEITPLEYQNGFFVDFKSGVRWCWHFDKNTKISFDFEKNGILNGKKMNFTLLIISALRHTPFRWSLKKV